jgi:hypothetical protein
MAATCETTVQPCRNPVRHQVYVSVANNTFWDMFSSDKYTTPVEVAFDDCEPTTGFGYAASISDDQEVQFMSKCSYTFRSAHEQHIQRQVHANYVAPECSDKTIRWITDDAHSIEQYVSPEQRLLYDSKSLTGNMVFLDKNNRRTEGFDPLHCISYTYPAGSDDHPRRRFAVVKQAVGSVCPTLGNRATRADTSMCRDADVTNCGYAHDTVMGGCATAACALTGFERFRKAWQNLNGYEGWERCSVPPPTVIPGQDRIANRVAILDRGFAHLADGLMKKGACGDEGLSCMAKLEGECGPIFAMASEAQCKGASILYRTLLRAGQTCIIDSEALAERNSEA